MTRPTEDLLLDLLQGRLFHCTGLNQFRQIQRDGFIRANTDERAFSFHRTEHSYGYSIGAVCLFDLRNQSLDVCRDGLFFRWSFHRFDSPVNIIMVLDGHSLDSKLIPNNAARTTNPYKDYIPYIEVWCIEPIPVSTITGCLVRCNVGHGEFAFTEQTDQVVEWVEQKVSEFQSKYADVYQERDEELKTANNLFFK